VDEAGAGEPSSEEAIGAFHDALLDDDPAALYDRAPCGYVSTLPDGTIVKANATFLTLTGYEREELVGRRTFADLLTAGGRIYHETHYAPMLQLQGGARAIALDIVCADRTRLPVLVNAVLERSADGQPVVVRAAVFDATDRRGYERELLRAKERAEASEARAVALARTLQQTLIPPTPPTIPGLDVAAAYRPAGDGSEVGGDFYDVFEVSTGDWVVAIGDVQGKGVEAAVVTALARHTIRAAAVDQSEPSQILTTLNTVLLRDDPTGRLCTVTVVRLRRAGGAWTATTSCGGHPAPLLSVAVALRRRWACRAPCSACSRRRGRRPPCCARPWRSHRALHRRGHRAAATAASSARSASPGCSPPPGLGGGDGSSPARRGRPVPGRPPARRHRHRRPRRPLRCAVPQAPRAGPAWQDRGVAAADRRDAGRLFDEVPELYDRVRRGIPPSCSPNSSP
jgi:sigma-B regulation protein RsbU (phosphoserine phosphatase)